MQENIRTYFHRAPGSIPKIIKDNKIYKNVRWFEHKQYESVFATQSPDFYTSLACTSVEFLLLSCLCCLESLPSRYWQQERLLHWCPSSLSSFPGSAHLTSVLCWVIAVLADNLHLTLKEDWVRFEHVCQCLRVCGVGEGTPEVVAWPVAQLPPWTCLSAAHAPLCSVSWLWCDQQS